VSTIPANVFLCP